MNRFTSSMYMLCVCIFLGGTALGQNTFERHYGGDRNDSGADVLEMSGGGFLLISTIRSMSDDTTDAWVVRTDALGETLWADMYGGSRFNVGVSLLPAPDGDYVLALATKSVWNKRAANASPQQCASAPSSTR